MANIALIKAEVSGSRWKHFVFDLFGYPRDRW
jgi:hypothetical protein